jgi:hypothetical protein
MDVVGDINGFWWSQDTKLVLYGDDFDYQNFL